MQGTVGKPFERAETDEEEVEETEFFQVRNAHQGHVR